MTDVTRILNAIEQGDAKAADEPLPLVYEELRRLAAQRMSQEKPGQTLQVTASVPHRREQPFRIGYLKKGSCIGSTDV